MSRYVTLPARGLAAAVAAVLLSASLAHAAAGDPVGLGTADSFAVLAGAGITNTGPTSITGDVGTFPTTTRTGFGSVTLVGTDHGGDAVTQGAKDDLVTAYDDAFGRTPATPHAVELGGEVLLAGVYASPTFGLTGTVTLDAQGDPDAQWVFQAGSTLIAEVESTVALVNGASPCRVVWQVGSSATFKTGTEFAGDVLAYTSITAQTSATFRGRLLARNGAVTLDTNTVTNAECAESTGGAPTPSATPVLPDTSTGPTSGNAPAVPAVRTVPAGPAGPAAPNGPGTPVRPTLPSTGSRGGLTVAGLLLLAAGSLLVVAGGPRATPSEMWPRRFRAMCGNARVE